jgi:acetoin utilization protein AcuB
VKITEIMTRNVVTLSPDQTLREAIELLRARHIRHLPVVEEDSRLVGIVTDRDVKQATPSLHSGVDRAEYERILAETSIAQVMTREPITITPATPLRTAVMIFIDNKVGAVPVVDEGRLIGIVSEIDLLRVLLDTMPE